MPSIIPPPPVPDNITITFDRYHRLTVKDGGVTPSKLAFNTFSVYTLTISSATTTFQITGLFPSADKLYLLYGALVNESGETCTYKLYFGDDFLDTDYYVQYLLADSSISTISRINAPEIMTLGPGSSGSFIIIIPFDPLVGPRAIIITSEDMGDVVKVGVKTLSTIVSLNYDKITLVASATDGIGYGSEFMFVKKVI